MRTILISKKHEEIRYFIGKFGPDAYEYPIINNLLNSVNNDELKEIKELFLPVLNEGSMFGHAYTKPLGYAGDYFLIEKMYQKHRSDNLRLMKWDDYYHSLEAGEAVRNRKKFFIETMEHLCKRTNGPTKVLILGSGPATDVNEFLVKNPLLPVSFDLLDIDQKAIDYAQHKNRLFSNQLKFTRMNVLRFIPDKKYDLIWSAGLFDYLNDRLVINLMDRFKNYLNEKSEMIIGNFSTNNPTRNIMEAICEWILIHRSEEHLMKLAANAGISSKNAYVDKEPLGINLFLRIRNEGS